MTAPEGVLVDPEDEHLLNGYSWWRHPTPRTTYIRGWIDGKHVLLHRLIMDAPDGIHVDHENGNGFDNRRENLRLATRSQNNANSGPRNGRRFKGVYRYKRAVGKWQAKIMLDGKLRHLGTFDTPEEAARAYDTAAIEAFGEFAWLNYGGTQ